MAWPIYTGTWQNIMLELEIFSILTATLTSSVALRSVSIWLVMTGSSLAISHTVMLRIRANSAA